MNPYLVFFVAAAVIVVAGSFLSTYADRIAEETGLGRLLIGSILLAAVTSLPELTVDISAVRQGLPDVAVGDLMGSSLMNLMILGFLDLLPSSRGRALRRISIAHALPATLSIALTALASISIASRGLFPVLNVSLGTLLILVAYTLGIRMIYKDQKLNAPLPSIELPMEGQIHARGALIRALVGFGIAALVILLTGPFLSNAAGQIADRTGLGGTFVGTTLVALSTSLPELVSCLAALRIGAPDLALGNIFGSNVFNMVLLLPLDFVHPGALFAEVSPTHALTGLATIVITSLVVMGQLYQVENRKRLIEPEGVLILTTGLAALFLVYHFASH